MMAANLLWVHKMARLRPRTRTAKPATARKSRQVEKVSLKWEMPLSEEMNTSLTCCVFPRRFSSIVSKKSAKRVKWVDHFGGDLNSTRQINDDGDDSSKPAAGQPNVSWSDRKKRDRLREKELLAKAK